MRLAPAVFAAAGLLSAALRSAGQEDRPPSPPVAAGVPSFESRVDLVTVDVVVLDAQGRPARDLRREDFSVFEDGRRQEIATFESYLAPAVSPPAAPSPEGRLRGEGLVPASASAARSFVVLVDDLSLAPFRQEDVRRALARFVEAGLSDADEVLYATTSGDAWWRAKMPEGREDLLALIARVRGRQLSPDANDAVSEWEAFRITHVEAGGGRASANTDGTPPPTGPPTGVIRPASLPGTDTTDRVVLRYYDRLVCFPGLPPTPREQCAAMVRRQAQLVDERRTARTRDVLAAIDRAVFALTGRPGRKALLLVTEGFLNDPDLRGLQEVAGRSREANVAIHSLDVRGLVPGHPGMSATEAGTPNAAETGLMGMEQAEAAAAGNVGLAEDTGGFAIRDTNDLGGGAVRVAEESRVYYLLGFAPPEGKGPRDWRKLQVKVHRPGLTVRARKGYTLRSAAEMALAGPPAPDRRPPEVTRALLAPHEREDLRLRARAYAFADRPGGKVSMVIAVEADTRSLANLGGDRPRSVLTLSIAATHRDTGAVAKVDQHVTVEAGLGNAWEGWLTLHRELDLAPGVTQARVVVRDDFLGRVGAITLRFEVPAPGGWRLATPILTDRLRPRARGEAPVPVILARRDFSPRGQLYCHFQILGAPAASGEAAPLGGAFLVRDDQGATVIAERPTALVLTADGRRVGFLGIRLDGLSPGSYDLVLRVRDIRSGRVIEQAEPFRVGDGT